MNIDTYKLPISGDSIEFMTEIWSEEKGKISLTAKLSRSELTTSINTGCIKSNSEGETKLRNYSIDEAKKIYLSGKFKDGDKYEKWFSPCW